MIFYVYPVCSTFSISYSVLPFLSVYVFQFLHLFSVVVVVVLSQGFIKCSIKASVQTHMGLPWWLSW